MTTRKGYVCATVPQTGPAGIGFISMLGWGNAVTILPEMLYQQFGDEEALPRQYESMKLFVEAEIRKMGKEKSLDRTVFRRLACNGKRDCMAGNAQQSGIECLYRT